MKKVITAALIGMIAIGAAHPASATTSASAPGAGVAGGSAVTPVWWAGPNTICHDRYYGRVCHPAYSRYWVSGHYGWRGFWIPGHWA